MSKDMEIYLVSKTPMETIAGEKTGGEEHRVMVFAALESAKRSDYMQIYGAEGKQRALLVFVINREDADLADQIIRDEDQETRICAEYVEYQGRRYRIENRYGVDEFDLKLTCSEVE